ncbi:MAG: NADH-quinone oxidoreductase subunit M [Patulibacter minatonensis]
MNGVLIALLAGPLAAGLLGLLVGRKAAPALAVLGTTAALVLATILVFGVHPGARDAAVDINEPWIPSIGVAFHIAVDGLNAVLVLLTTFVFWIGTLWSLKDRELATPSYLFLLAIGEAAVLGAFVAQDLALFVLCFDLMLLPFVLIAARGAGGDGEWALRPVLVLLVYTLVGSLLMFVAAVGLAVLTAKANGGSVSFDLATLYGATLAPSTQRWILLAFLAAFLIKMPIVPFHGWFPGSYRTMPLPALAIFAAILSKVAAYGFLRIALPLLPDAIVDLRLLLVILALVSIIYGSVIAFTTNEPRLILGYSSVAQLGFILLGISSLDPLGAQGAIFQSVTHALVVVPAVILLAVVSERSGGVERLDQLGGIARRAPVLAATFLVIVLCWLAMPGSGNFVAEYLVLLGQWQVAPWATIIASLGVVLAAYYALRFMIGAMQNARGAAVPEDAPEIGKFEASLLGICVGALVLVSLVPQLGLRPSEVHSRAVIFPARSLYESQKKADRESNAATQAPDASAQEETVR